MRLDHNLRMLNILSNLFRPSPALDTEIPRYPPFAKGLPAVKEDRLLTTQQELLDKLRQALPFDQAQFDRLMLPVIKRYAAFVHLLPASETHHHRGAGGLLHHGLEVAHIAARSSEDVMFAANEEPRRRRELEPRWRLAVCLAGLTHDVGKPVSDLSVTDSTGEHVWNAYTENLADWTTRESVERYFLHWHKGRHRRHEQFSVLVMERVLTRECLNWLAEYGPEIPHALLNSVAMADTDNNDIGPLIRRADNTSVERDMRRYQASPNESLGVPVERYILDAMRRLVSQGKWRVNEKGSRIWMLTDGLHVVWPAAADEILRVLKRDGVAGVPRDPDSIADILIDRSLVIQRKTESTTYRYWPMRPASFDDNDPNRLMMLRLSAPDLIFSEPPSPIAAEVIESRPKPKAKHEQTTAQSKGPEKKHRSQPIVAAEGAHDEQDERRSRPGEPEASETADVHDSPADAFSPDEQLAASMPYLQDEVDEPNSHDDPRIAPGANAVTPASDQNQAPVEQNAVVNNVSSSKQTEPAGISFNAGQAEPILQALHAGGEWETHLFRRSEQVVIAYPEGAALGGSPAEVQRILADEGLLKTDPLSPMLKVRTFEGIKGLLLTPDVSALFLGQNEGSTESPESGSDGTRQPDGDPVVHAPPAHHSEQAKARHEQIEGTPEKATASRESENTDRRRPRKSKKKKTNTPQSADQSQFEQNSQQALAASSGPGEDAAPKVVSDRIAGGLIDAIRDPDSKVPCRRDRENGWIYVSQVVLQWYASSLTQTSAATVRDAIGNHSDIVLEGRSRIGIREVSHG